VEFVARWLQSLHGFVVLGGNASFRFKDIDILITSQNEQLMLEFLSLLKMNTDCKTFSGI
jgi:hypothetical protein